MQRSKCFPWTIKTLKIISGLRIWDICTTQAKIGVKEIGNLK